MVQNLQTRSRVTAFVIWFFIRIQESTQEALQFQDGANNDILINPNGTGKVGVGTTAPASKLHVSDGNASGLTNASNVSLIIGDAEVPRIYFEDTGEGSGDKVVALSYLDENLKIQSVTDNGSAYDQENILVANRDGNVGIGTVPSQNFMLVVQFDKLRPLLLFL